MLLKLTKSAPCRRYVAQLEEAIPGANVAAGESTLSSANPSLAAHLRECHRCREALRDARLAGGLLREVRQPHSLPDDLFASRVIAGIRAKEEKLHLQFEFWNPIEVLARRLVWASSVLLLVLSSALYQMRASGSPAIAQDTIVDRYPDLVPDQPANKDEVLVSLAEKAHE